MTKAFKDRFSHQAAQYSLYRPHYPETLFSYLVSLVTERNAAWDCATGNGQSASSLAESFSQVYATDASSRQIAQAIRKPNIFYSVSPAEKTSLPDRSVDLVTVAQAIHWFDTESFYREVRRVLKNNGVFAAWAYHLPIIEPEIDRIIHQFYSVTLEKFWEKEIRHIQSGYRTLLFPFPEISHPSFSITTAWSFHQVIGYLETWSALNVCRKTQGNNPLNTILPELRMQWKNPEEIKKAEWPIMLKVALHTES
ncbi:MAG: class I SAM-dependent methyltransferase [Ignavibacteriaceae bacterium]|nr:class I SAM-dependent methyltransferase [Ignavibacteriaceae bacterium]